jgi:hypothetical protein
MGCHLGWHFTVGCPLRGGRGKCKKIGTSVPPKTIKKKKKKKKYIAIGHSSQESGFWC